MDKDDLKMYLLDDPTPPKFDMIVGKIFLDDEWKYIIRKPDGRYEAKKKADYILGRFISSKQQGLIRISTV
tara:strand:+ start:179 stop:391 length:213 start_codon:yes stop_codon:yes gene_type:complete